MSGLYVLIFVFFLIEINSTHGLWAVCTEGERERERERERSRLYVERTTREPQLLLLRQPVFECYTPVSYTHLDVYKRQIVYILNI